MSEQYTLCFDVPEPVIWRTVRYRNQEHPTHEVSNQGVVRRTAAPGVPKASLISVGRINAHGYPSITIYLTKTKKITPETHRVVMETFVGACPLGMNVNHKDGVKTNNALANLEYVTFKENTAHGISMGLINPHRPRPSIRGERSHWSKLTDRQVEEIRALKGTMSLSAIAKIYGIAKQYVFDLCKRKARPHPTAK